MRAAPAAPIIASYRPVRRGRAVACLALVLVLAAGPAVAIEPRTCSFASIVEDLRRALRDGSPALQQYLKELLKEAALATPADELVHAVQAERDPGVLEALGAALATKAGNEGAAHLVQPLLTRAVSDADPRMRAAAVRGLRGAPSVELMAKNGGVVTYEQLVRDPDPAVRAAAAKNLLEEDAKIYHGHDRSVTEAAVAAAAASRDPEVTAQLLEKVSMEQAGREAIQRVTGHLGAEDPRVRGAAAAALGGAPADGGTRARRALVDRWRDESDPAVRRSILAGLARLGGQDARTALRSLRGSDPATDRDIDAWLATLDRGLQEWRLIEREHARRRGR